MLQRFDVHSHPGFGGFPLAYKPLAWFLALEGFEVPQPRAQYGKHDHSVQVRDWGIGFNDGEVPKLHSRFKDLLRAAHAAESQQFVCISDALFMGHAPWLIADHVSRL